MSLLEGVKVVELPGDTALTVCGRILAYWKADVVKIERLNAPAQAQNDKAGKLIREAGDAGKRSITIDLSTPEGQAIFGRLLENADVLLAGPTIDKADGTQLDIAELTEKYPELICASVSAYGGKGELAGLPGSGAGSFWARSGFSGFFGEPDAPPVTPLYGMDAQVTGAYLANGIAAALIGRDATGRGERVETSMYHSAIWSAGLFNATSNYWENPRKTRRRPDAPLINSFRARDGKWFSTAIMEHERFWPLLCDCIGRPDLAGDERFSLFKNAALVSEELTSLLDAVFAEKDRDEWLALFETADIPAGAIFDARDVLSDGQALENDYLKKVLLDDGGEAILPTPPYHFSETDTGDWAAAPQRGADTIEILKGAGCETADIAALIARKVVGGTVE